MTDWHLMHLGTLALSGASMMVIEATGVTPEDASPLSVSACIRM